MLTFNYAQRPFTLRHSGDCGFIGITPAAHLYVEEFYGDDHLAQHHLDENGQMMESVDEGQDDIFAPLYLPENLIRPRAIKAALPLNYIGARYRGMREAERLSDMARSLTVVEKMTLLDRLSLKIPAMMLAGIAESRVLSEAPLNDAGLFMVCRRVLLAVMLSEQHIDTDGQPYDYETLPLYVAHIYDVSADFAPPLHQALDGISGAKFTRPLECLTQHDYLYIAEGGDKATGARSQIHVWKFNDE